MTTFSIKKPMFLTAGNFPSVAANTIQIAKMASAYAAWIPNIEVVMLSGLKPFLCSYNKELADLFGLSRKIKFTALPLLVAKTDLTFGQDYRPPKWFYRLVGNYARLRRADLVFTRKIETAIVTIQGKIRTVLEFHDPWESVPQFHEFKNLLANKALCTIVVISEPLRESYNKAGFSNDSIVVAPDGVDLEQYTPILSKGDARRKLGINTERFLCIHTGHLLENRGIETVLSAAAQLPEIDFLFVGGWQRDVEKYEKMSKEMGLKNAAFVGSKPHSLVPTYQFAADVLLMPYSAKLSTADRCSPLKLFEYLAASRPIVSSDLPILHSVLKDQENALMVKPDSAEALAKAICVLQNDSELSSRISANARNDSQKFSWDERARKILEHVTRGMKNEVDNRRKPPEDIYPLW